MQELMEETEQEVVKRKPQYEHWSFALMNDMTGLKGSFGDCEDEVL